MNAIPVLSEMIARGEKPEVLFWVGCAGSFDDRARKVTRSLAILLQRAGVSFAVLGGEESCSGDPARRAGNEFLFQMQALTNIQVMNAYSVTRIVTACPHCFNTLKNEYPELGGNYDVLHHTQLLQQLLDEGRLRVKGGSFTGKKITYHDPCYLGRANSVYEAPRQLIAQLDGSFTELKRSRKNGLCCGAGGAQMFKEPEPGKKDINTERSEEALASGAEIIAVACPFCMTMLSDGVKLANQEDQVQVKDLSELLFGASDSV